MTAPTVAAVTRYGSSGSSSTHTLSYPASGVSSGDTFVLVYTIDGSGNAPSLTGPTATSLDYADYGGSGLGGAGAFTWAADGTENGGTFTLNTGGGVEQACAHLYHITGAAAFGTSPPEIATAVTGSAANPDPPSITPSGGSADYLYIAFGGSDGITAYTAGPYSNFIGDETSSGGAVSLGSDYTQTTGSSSEDPGAFTRSSDDYYTNTIAVYPAAGGGGASFFVPSILQSMRNHGFA